MKGKENSILNHFSGKEGREKDEKSPDDSIFYGSCQRYFVLSSKCSCKVSSYYHKTMIYMKKKIIQAHLFITSSSCPLLVLVKGTVSLEDSTVLF